MFSKPNLQHHLERTTEVNPQLSIDRYATTAEGYSAHRARSPAVCIWWLTKDGMSCSFVTGRWSCWLLAAWKLYDITLHYVAYCYMKIYVTLCYNMLQSLDSLGFGMFTAPRCFCLGATWKNWGSGFEIHRSYFDCGSEDQLNLSMFDTFEVSTVHTWEEILAGSQKVGTNPAGLVKKSLFVWNLVSTCLPLFS